LLLELEDRREKLNTVMADVHRPEFLVLGSFDQGAHISPGFETEGTTGRTPLGCIFGFMITGVPHGVDLRS